MTARENQEKCKTWKSPLNHGGVVGRHVVVQNARSTGRTDATRAEVVLGNERNAVQRPQGTAPAEAVCGCLSFRTRGLRAFGNEEVQTAERLGARQAVLDQVHRGKSAGGEGPVQGEDLAHES